MKLFYFKLIAWVKILEEEGVSEEEALRRWTKYFKEDPHRFLDHKGVGLVVMGRNGAAGPFPEEEEEEEQVERNQERLRRPPYPLRSRKG